MAATGQGMVLTTEQQVPRHQPGALVWRPVQGVEDDHVTWVARRRPGTVLVRALVGHLRRVAAHPPAPPG